VDPGLGHDADVTDRFQVVGPLVNEPLFRDQGSRTVFLRIEKLDRMLERPRDSDRLYIAAYVARRVQFRIPSEVSVSVKSRAS